MPDSTEDAPHGVPRGDANDAIAVEGFRSDAVHRFLGAGETYFLTRFVFLRLLGFVYFVAFVSLARQLGPLIGHDGLLPAADFLARVEAALGSRSAGFARLPTLFWLGAPDAALHTCAWIGAALSLAVCAGVTNAFVQLALWALYLSFVHVGQVFYGYGWETQLLETGFLAIFLCPARGVAAFPASPPPRAVIWLLRWLIFRVMLGAGLIKLRGDPCWRDLTCLVYHYETQPVPNPLSWLLHKLPRSVQALSVLSNHFVELVVPWFVFGWRRPRLVAGVLLVLFQMTLIVSGNLSFLNWITIAPAIACFDDRALGRVFPARLRARVAAIAAAAVPSRAARSASYALTAVVLVLSVNPVLNLMSPRQAMNTSFDPFALVNTYGAFGSVGRERHEVILQGTSDEVIGPETRWVDYELPCKPGDPARRPCVITPYHYRLDWQMWFAALSTYEREPWIVHLVYLLLEGDPGVKSLLATDPFPSVAPRFIRAELYRYRFTDSGARGTWWERVRIGEYLRPLSLGDPALSAFLDAHGFRHGGLAPASPGDDVRP